MTGIPETLAGSRFELVEVDKSAPGEQPEFVLSTSEGGEIRLAGASAVLEPLPPGKIESTLIGSAAIGVTARGSSVHAIGTIASRWMRIRGRWPKPSMVDPGSAMEELVVLL
jgi:hypothetical protein